MAWNILTLTWLPKQIPLYLLTGLRFSDIAYILPLQFSKNVLITRPTPTKMDHNIGNLSEQELLLWNTSLQGLDIFYQQTTTYSFTVSVLLTVLYVPLFIVSLLGNVSALAVLVRTVFKRYVMKTAFLINLVIADLAGKYRTHTIF